MTIFADPIDSGEILHRDLVDTYVLDIPAADKPTRSLTKYLRTLPPTRALRLADARPAAAHDTGELPLITTGAEVVVRGLPTAAAPDVRPDGYRPRHRRPDPVWALLVTGAGLGYLALAAAGAALAVLR